jgi:hypothetical protein
MDEKATDMTGEARSIIVVKKNLEVYITGYYKKKTIVALFHINFRTRCEFRYSSVINTRSTFLYLVLVYRGRKF